MFGSLILPTGTGTGAGTGSSSSSRPKLKQSQKRDQLSAIGSTPYHPTMSFPNRNPPTNRIRASFAADTLPRVQLSKPITTTHNLYQILQIKEDASPLEIKTAYRRLAKQFHPDASPPTTTSGSDDDHDKDGARDFMEIHNAYATLSDPTERARYDLSIQSHRKRFHRYYSSSASASASAATDGYENRSRSVGYGVQTRRWETDQCW